VKIGIYDPYLDDLGGGEKYMMTIAECLSAKNGVDVFWDGAQDFKALNQRFSLDLTKVNLVPNIFSAKTPIFKKLLETRKYDAIIVLSDGSIPLSLSKKLFLHVQQPLKSFNPQTLMGKIKLSRVNAIFCNSEYTKSFNKEKFNLKSYVVYPPVSISPKKIQKENIILTVGRFRVKDVVTKTDDYKKLPVMIETFKKLVNKGLSDWKFILAVSVQEKDKNAFNDLRESAKGFPIEFLVNKSNEQLREEYSKAKIYWHASGFGEDLITHPEFAEHFGISTVEAMESGVVPVVINAGGQKEIVENGVNGFLWNTIEELESETLELTENDKLLKELSENAKKISKKFSKNKFCYEINNLILQ